MVTSVGDEGGYAPKLSSNEEAFKTVIEAIKMLDMFLVRTSI